MKHIDAEKGPIRLLALIGVLVCAGLVWTLVFVEIPRQKPVYSTAGGAYDLTGLESGAEQWGGTVNAPQYPALPLNTADGSYSIHLYWEHIVGAPSQLMLDLSVMDTQAACAIVLRDRYDGTFTPWSWVGGKMHETGLKKVTQDGVRIYTGTDSASAPDSEYAVVSYESHDCVIILYHWENDRLGGRMDESWYVPIARSAGEMLGEEIIAQS